MGKEKCYRENFYFAKFSQFGPLLLGHLHLTGQKFMNSPLSKAI